tara:strand:- start:10197 stop:10448 length:252 start_codon:yes stop_codon:yes gene_type:complete
MAEAAGSRPLWMLAGGDIPPCWHGGDYLRFPCPSTPHRQQQRFFQLFLSVDTQFSQSNTTIMSGVSIKLKTPQTGEYEQPTGL